MTKRGRNAVVMAALLLAVTGLILWLAPKWRTRLGQHAVPPVAAREEIELPPLPDISLQIDRQHDLVVDQGTPLLFAIRLASPRAMNAGLANQANQAYADELQARLARGAVSRERAEAQIARLRRAHKLRPVQLGDQVTSWEQFVRFVERLPDGKDRPLPWSLKLVAPPEAKTLILDAKNTAQLDYLLEVVTASQVPTGDYQIVAVLEVPADARIAADCWRGRVESEPVKISIVQKPARMAPEEEETTDLQFARYYQASKDWTHALESAQKALAANPKSIPAHILVGEVKEAQGDLRGALKAYQVAEEHFYQQYPNSYEAPLYLIDKIDAVTEQLADQH